MNDPRSAWRAHPTGSVIDVWHSADGWPHRRFRWPAKADAGKEPARGTILYQCGRGDFFEKYLGAFAHWHDRGWNLESFDWRGQGLSGRLTDDPEVGHADDFSVWTGELREYWQDLSAREPGRKILMGHSMGGHLALRALVDAVVAPDAAVLIAPMLGFYGPVPVALGSRVARFLAGTGDPKRAAWRGGEKPGAKASLRQTLLTRCNDQYADELFWRDQHPEFRLGAASWGWVDQAYRSNAVVFAAGALERIKMPVLALSALADKLVDPRATARAMGRLPHGKIHAYGDGAAHELLREVDAVRMDALGRIDDFLDATAKP